MAMALAHANSCRCGRLAKVAGEPRSGLLFGVAAGIA